jgi:signal transduction histidine kinase
VEVRQLLRELASHPAPTAQPQLLPPAEPFTVRHIPYTPLLQIFSNLVGNARRYAGTAGAPIEVGAQRHGQRVLFYVRDHGPGIPENERGRIFETFYRGATTRSIPGSGVGLATVRKIARTYGGRAWVEETAGGGSTFWVEMVDEPQQAPDAVDTPLPLLQLVHGDYCQWSGPAPLGAAGHGRASMGSELS